MKQMFESAHTFEGTGLSYWNVEAVTEMNRMFASTQNFNAKLSWNTIQVTTMKEMFRASRFNNDVSSFNVAQVTTMYYMFYETPFDSNISHWDTGRVTNFDGMLRKTPFDQDISKWIVSSATSMTEMFRDTSHFNQDISKVCPSLFFLVCVFSNFLALFFTKCFFWQWDIAKVVSIKRMFYASLVFNQNLSAWDITNIPNDKFNEAFRNARSFKYKPSIDLLWGERSTLYPGSNMFAGTCAVDPLCGFCGKSTALVGSSVTCSIAAQPRVEPFQSTPCFFCRNDGYECCNPVGCSPGSYRPSDATEAVCITMSNSTCPVGESFFSTSATDKSLLTGSTKDDGFCAPCEKGKFKNVMGPELCTICPPGEFQNETNSTSCVLCAAGKSLTTAGTSVYHDDVADCEECRIFTFSPVEGQSDECYPCLSATQTGAKDCAGCHPGK